MKTVMGLQQPVLGGPCHNVVQDHRTMEVTREPVPASATPYKFRLAHEWTILSDGQLKVTPCTYPTCTVCNS